MTNTRKTLIALAAGAALTIGFGASAQANSNVNIDFGINLGGAGLFDSGYGGGYYDTGYGDDDDCGYKMIKTKHWNWNHTHKIISWSKQWVCY